MQIYNFAPETAHVILAYDSQNISLTHIAADISSARVVVMYIAQGGTVGFHPTQGDQLFLVVQGSGWVTGGDRRRRNIAAGQAAFWQNGEWHESGSEAGMTAVIIEAESIQPRLEISD